jgi:hypothetical protein
MSSYMVINAASAALRRTLWQSFEADPILRSIVGSEAAIVLQNPTQAVQDSANRMSVWLYRVGENEHVKNRPPMRVVEDAQNPDGTTRITPMALDLNYLVTPLGQSGEADQLLLGRTLETLYDASTLFLLDRASRIAEELRVILCQLALEELAHVWEALQEPYRLSVCYELKVARIDSARIPVTARVIDRIAGFGDPAEREVA